MEGDGYHKSAKCTAEVFEVEAGENGGGAHPEAASGWNVNGDDQSGSVEFEWQPSIEEITAPMITDADQTEVRENFSLIHMPMVSTRSAGVDGKEVKGFLHRYRTRNGVCIVCMCHGRVLSPAEFVRHGGGGHVEEPLKHIIVICEGIPRDFFKFQ